ncbi:uncharacterized protein LOC120328633 [Styela clava]
MAGRSDNNPSQRPLALIKSPNKITVEGKNSIGIECNNVSSHLDILTAFAANVEINLKSDDSKGLVANIKKQSGYQYCKNKQGKIGAKTQSKNVIKALPRIENVSSRRSGSDILLTWDGVPDSNILYNIEIFCDDVKLRETHTTEIPQYRMKSPTLGKQYHFQVSAKNKQGKIGAKTQSKNVIKVKKIGIKGDTMNLNECKVAFPDGTFNEQTKVWMSVGLDNSICPAEYVAITPVLDISAESTLRKNAIVQMKSWCLELKKEDFEILHFTNDTDWNIIKPDLVMQDRTIEFRCQEFSRVIAAIKRLFSAPVVKENLFYLVGKNQINFAFFNSTLSTEESVKGFYKGLDAKLLPARFNPFVLRRGDKIHVKLRVEGNPENLWFNKPVFVNDDFLKKPRHNFEFELLPIFQQYPEIVIKCEMEKNGIDREIKKFKFPLDSPRENRVRDTEPRSGEQPSLADIEDLCGLVEKIEVIPCDRNDYEKSFTDKGIYSITKPKGLALILNNTFKGIKGKERKGSEIDVKNMTTLWKKLGCKLYGNKTFPKPWESDKTGKQMKDLLGEVSEIKTKYSFIVIVIMTHGGIDKGKPVFEGSDHKLVEVKKIEEMFFNTKNGNLQNIPKFFIYQFCRGTIIDRSTIAADNKMKEPVMESSEKVCVQTDGARRMPTVSDIFVAYPTHEEHAAIRNIYEGSWFINAITNVFMRQAAKHHVADMLTIVNRAMKEKTGTNEAKAMSEQKTSLSQFFYLFPGFPV